MLMDSEQFRELTLLSWASYAGHDEVVDMLLTAGANANTVDKVHRGEFLNGSCLHIVCSTGVVP